MTEDTNAAADTTADAATSTNDFDKLKELVEKICADGPKGLEGNKQAARRARSALNELKKLCTPIRIQIQGAVKKPKA